MAPDLEALPKVDIDNSGIFKYVLLKAHSKENQDAEPVLVVRGYQRCSYHADIYDEVQEANPNVDFEPIGGGRIQRDNDNKKIHVYGYSQAYGKADHEVTVGLLQKEFPDYTFSISDEGY